MRFTKKEFKYGTMYLGDCLEVLPSLDRNSVEVAVTSPPYNLCKRYSDYKRSKTSTSMTEKYEKWYSDDLPEWQYQGQQQAMMFELIRVCRSSIFYNHNVQ